MVATDYYPFGMPMPNRNMEGGYRYGYQGEFAEKEGEMPGVNSFELRLWDSRIGRWLTTDPYGQYSSPYIGMGNDPVNGIDSDGGYKTRIGAILGWIGGGFKGSIIKGANPLTQYHNFGIKNSYIENGVNVFNVNFGNITGKLIDAGGVVTNQGAWFFAPQIREASGLMQFEFWRNKQPESLEELGTQVAVELTYGTAENAWGTFTGKRFSGSPLQGYHRVDAGVNIIVSAATFALSKVVKGSAVTVESSIPLYNKFAKATVGQFKGINHAKLRGSAYKEMIRMHNIKAMNVKLAKDFDKFSTKVDRINISLDELLND